MAYGIPYQGSKNAIARELINILPPAETFNDVFCGGCAMTHMAILSGKYKHYVINDLDPMMPQAFVDAINGKFNKETRWISREEFQELKDTDPYASICFSFGNNRNNYAYGDDRVELKKALFVYIKQNDNTLLKEYVDIEPKETEAKRLIQCHKAFKSEFQSIEALSRLSRLSRYLKEGDITQYNTSYSDVPIRGGGNILRPTIQGHWWVQNRLV